MTPSPACLELVKQFEGYRKSAYKCPAGVWTIGYGSTKGIKEGDTCTADEAQYMLTRDLMEAGDVVNDYVQVPINQNQFDALASFVYNLGAGNFRSSTLLRLLNGGQYQAAAAQLTRWNKANGQVLPGLMRRRLAERELFERAM